eukprot:SM000351S13218  [mRNA]  locus=s351:23433:27034:- [translate_table: standard]
MALRASPDHVLRSKGGLRIAVLVAEFAGADLDGRLLDTWRRSAALGLPRVELVNGADASSVAEKLRAAVRSLAQNRRNFDYLLLEASGLSDPSQIAVVLVEEGVEVRAVIALVDTEALDEALTTEAGARQLAAADLVLINKFGTAHGPDMCDLLPLGAIADVEDRVEQATSGRAQAVRCRFGNVPLELVVDIPPLLLPPMPTTVGANRGEGFLSHEATSTLTTVSRTPALHFTAGAEGRAWKEHACIAGLQGAVHNDSVTSVVYQSDHPLPLHAFQDFVLHELRPAHGLLRSKGVLWFQECRQLRAVFQGCGRQRAELLFAGAWDGPPGCSLVLIGRSRPHLEALLRLLSKLQEACSGTGSVRGTPRNASVLQCQRDVHASVQDCSVPGVTSQSTVEADETASTGKSSAAEATDSQFEDVASTSKAAKELEEKLAADKIFKVAASTGSIVRFGLCGDPLKGLSEDSLNSSLMTSINETAQLFVSGMLTAETGLIAQVALAMGADIQEMSSVIRSSGQRVLTRAKRDICYCRCDISPHMFHKPHQGSGV